MFVRFWCWQDPVTFLQPLDKSHGIICANLVPSKTAMDEIMQLRTSVTDVEGAPKKGAFHGPQMSSIHTDKKIAVQPITVEVEWISPLEISATCETPHVGAMLQLLLLGLSLTRLASATPCFSDAVPATQRKHIFFDGQEMPVGVWELSWASSMITSSIWKILTEACATSLQWEYAQEADTWCLGCSSLELSLGLLKQQWRHPGLRAVAEEALLSSARLVRAFANLDSTLVGGSAGSLDRAPRPATSAKSRGAPPARSRSPQRRRDERPPLPRSPKRTSKELPEAKRPEHSESEDFDEEGEEEEEEEDRPTEVKKERSGSGPPPEPEGNPPQKGEETRRDDRDRGREVRREPQRSSHHSSHHRPKDKNRRRRRGGTRHQRRKKDQLDPFRRSHRRLRSDQVELAGSFQEGLDRRY
eukprot:s3186_g2.t1